jgi:hypothetical protein
MNSGRAATILVLVSLVLTTHSFAGGNGGVPLRIRVGPSQECIDGRSDRIWVTMYRAVISKQKHFFSEESQAELIMTVHVRTDPAISPSLSFPLSAKVDIDNYSIGQVSLPVEYTIIDGLALKQTEGGRAVYYKGFGIDATLVNLRAKNGLGTALDSLQKVTSSGKIPIPPNPYTAGVGYLMTFANDAIASDIAAKNDNDKYVSESLTINVSPTGVCGPDGSPNQLFERTGVRAWLMGDGTKDASYVPIDQSDNYCFAADIEPVFAVKATPKAGSVPCSDSSYDIKYKAVSNDFVAFLVQRQPADVVENHLGPPTESQKRKLAQLAHAKKEAAAWCSTLKLTECRAAK